ncbi:MAG TPA: hypothetical protein VIL25_07995 [Vicinamibacterales bacterium]
MRPSFAPQALVLALATAAGAQTLIYDNGPIITHPTGGAGGLPASALDNTATYHSPHNTYGFGAQAPPLADNSLADDFTVCGTWNVSHIEVFGYATGVNPPSATAVFCQIWNGPPNAGGTVIWGNLTTNLLTSPPQGTLECYRVLIGTLTDTQRPVQAIRVPVPASTPLTLTPGVYWLEFQFSGVNFCPPVTETGVNETGNGLQRQTTAWIELNNAIAPNVARCAVPFRFYGTATGGVPASATAYGAGKSGTNGIGAWDLGTPVRTPILGRDYPLRLINGFSGSAPIVALGTPFASGIPIAPVGVVYVNPILVTIPLPAFDASNASELRLPIPHGANLCGLQLGVQGFWGDPGAAGSIGHSDGLLITVGN